MAKGNGKRPGSYTVVYSPDGEKSLRCHVDDIPGGWVRTDPNIPVVEPGDGDGTLKNSDPEEPKKEKKSKKEEK
jgi:hypothetical protein